MRMSGSAIERDGIKDGIPAADSGSKNREHNWRPAAEGLYDPALEKDSCGVGFTLPQSMAGAMMPFPDRAGAASSLLGIMQIGFASIVGAVVGEFVSSDRGLGFLINIGRGQYDTALVFLAIFALMVMALSLYGIVVLLEKRMLKWRKLER